MRYLIYKSTLIILSLISMMGMVFGQYNTSEPEDKTEEGKKWQEILENLNPEDFGKYKM